MSKEDSEKSGKGASGWVFGEDGLLRKALKRGRKSNEKRYNYLSEAKGFQSVPVEIELSEEAPVELLKAASLTNFLNGYEMDDNVRAMCNRWGLDAKKISSDRELYALQIQTMRDHLQDTYSDKVMDLASWIMGETTAGMGSVMAAMTGDYTKYGNPRNRE